MGHPAMILPTQAELGWDTQLMYQPPLNLEGANWMPRPEPEFDGTEGDILIAIYEWPDVPSSTYSLNQKLNPGLQITTPAYRAAFARVSNAIEEHVVRGLVRGKRSRGGDGVFFENLKLTYKGEQAAIQERQRRALPGKVKQLLEVAELIRERRDRGAGS
jgi:hypothetical protein